MKKSILWTILRLFPFIIIALFMIMRIGQGTIQYTEHEEFIQEIQDYLICFKFKPVYDKVWDALGTTELRMGYSNTRSIVSSLISYEILITLVHIAYSVFEFFPRFCISLFERKMKK